MIFDKSHKKCARTLAISQSLISINSTRMTSLQSTSVSTRLLSRRRRRRRNCSQRAKTTLRWKVLKRKLWDARDEWMKVISFWKWHLKSILWEVKTIEQVEHGDRYFEGWLKMLRTTIIITSCLLSLIFHLSSSFTLYCRKSYTAFFSSFLHRLTHERTKVRLALYFRVSLAREKRRFYILTDLRGRFVLSQRSKSSSV